MATPAPEPVRTLLRADPAAEDPLAGNPTRSHPGVPDKGAAQELAAADAPRLAALQERLFAEGSRSVLLVLQGMDTSGKGGTIKHVIGAMNPQGCRISSFKRPTPEEIGQHFLRRIADKRPAPGYVGVFDRSHYEDVLVVRVHSSKPDTVWTDRYDDINRFEAAMQSQHTTIVKCMLHISFEEQRERLLARLDEPNKHWKFNESDIDERRHWYAYQNAYRAAVRHCSAAAPWYVVPADYKWYRNWAVGRILIETLEELEPQYPSHPLDVGTLKKRLAAPG